MTKYPQVWAIGDITSVGTPKAGVFAEGAAHVAAASIIAEINGKAEILSYHGSGSCYVESGHNQVVRVDIDFVSGTAR
jgi:sulfide:quinone oxidoreductase